MVSVIRLASATSCSRVHLSRGGDRGFEPTSLQQGVCKPSVPRGGDRVVRKYATGLGLDRGYSAHPMRATFITAALENGAQLEEVAPLTPRLVTATGSAFSSTRTRGGR